MSQAHNNGVGGTISSSDASARLSSVVVDKVINKIRDTPSKNDGNPDYFKKIFDDYLKALDAEHQAAFVEYFSKNQDWAPHFDKIKKSWSNKKIITAGVIGIGGPALAIAAILSHEGYRLEKGVDGLFDGSPSSRDNEIIALIALLLVVSAVVSIIVVTKKAPNSKELEGIMNNAFRNAEKTVENAKRAKSAEQQQKQAAEQQQKQAAEQQQKQTAEQQKQTAEPKQRENQSDKTLTAGERGGSGINNSISSAGNTGNGEHNQLYERLISVTNAQLLEQKNAQMLLLEQKNNTQLLLQQQSAQMLSEQKSAQMLSEQKNTTLFQLQLQHLLNQNGVHLGNMNPYMGYTGQNNIPNATSPEQKSGLNLGNIPNPTSTEQKSSQLSRGKMRPPLHRKKFKNDKGMVESHSEVSDDDNQKNKYKDKHSEASTAEASESESESSSASADDKTKKKTTTARLM